MLKYFLVLFIIIPSFANTITGKIVKVVDGDTVHILLGDRTKEKIRLAGIDAPERKQAFGNKSKKYLSGLVAAETVIIEFDKRDRYGRIVGKIIFNGQDINLGLVQSGLAWHYKKYKREQSLDDQIAYAVAENNARKQKRGLWQDPHVVAPWKWRKNKKNRRSLKPSKRVQAQAILTNSNSTTSVWVNIKSGKYHCPGTRYYDNTKHGEMMLESIALRSGYAGAHGLMCN